ncbi:DUF5067 domain-containing protein [Enterococcus sp. LJL128]|uniref:DUF5067 domain-containing protein n=1 Tax=Enterococcus sp. LJL51 TaxID=3416656 RepID=UPI003CF77915
MTKKYSAIIFVAAVSLLFSGCAKSCIETEEMNKLSSVQSAETTDDGKISTEKDMNKEAIYENLANYAGMPKMIAYSEIIDETITFVAQMRGEPEEIISSDETLNGQWYIPVYLMRNRDTPIYLNISNIQKEKWPKNGDILQITGKPVGYLFTVHNNERVDVLDIEVSELKVHLTDSEKAADGKIIETDTYKITLIDTAVINDSFERLTLILYYNFKNKKEVNAVPPIRTYFFFKQEEELTANFLAREHESLNPSALNYEVLEPNVELLYYTAVLLSNQNEPVELTVYDDEYNLLSRVVLPVPTSEELSKR